MLYGGLVPSGFAPCGFTRKFSLTFCKTCSERLTYWASDELLWCLVEELCRLISEFGKLGCRIFCFYLTSLRSFSSRIFSSFDFSKYGARSSTGLFYSGCSRFISFISRFLGVEYWICTKSFGLRRLYLGIAYSSWCRRLGFEELGRTLFCPVSC